MDDSKLSYKDEVDDVRMTFSCIEEIADEVYIGVSIVSSGAFCDV